MYSYKTYAELPYATLRSSDLGEEAVANFYFSRLGYISSTADSPGGTLYTPRAIQPFRFRRSMINGEYPSGVVFSQGELILDNTDGGLDSFVVGHAFDARNISISLGSTDFSTTEFGLVFDGSVEYIDNTENQVRLVLRDKAITFDLNIQSNLYAGSGGVEGGTDLKDKPKPLAYGSVLNVPAVLVDPVSLVYQVHDGSVNDVPAVYDRGVSLTKTTASSGPVLGEYQVQSSVGTFTLGGAPDGEITADVLGDNSTSYVVTTADILKRIILNHTAISSSNLATTTFDVLNTLSTATVGIWIGTEARVVGEILIELLRGIGAFLVYRADDVGVRVGRFDLPTGDPQITLNDSNILTIARLNTNLVGDPPIWQAKVGYQRNYAVQTDLAGSVASRLQFTSQRLRLAKASDANVKNAHLLAGEPEPLETYFANSTDAQVEADRLLSIYKEPHFIYEITTREFMYDKNLNDTVFLQYPRWGLDGGKLGKLLEIDVDSDRQEFRVLVFV